jgi:chemotaxis protein CheC
LPIKSISNIDDQEIQEIITQGFQNAAHAFSELLHKSIEIKAPRISLIRYQDLPNLLGGPEVSVTGVYLRFEEKAENQENIFTGNLLILFTLDKAFEITGIMLSGLDYSSLDPKTVFESALCELGNITGSAVLNTFSDKFKIPILPSPPVVVTDMAGSILSSIAAVLSGKDDQIVLIETSFINELREIKGHFLILPDNRDGIFQFINRVGADKDDR